MRTNRPVSKAPAEQVVKDVRRAAPTSTSDAAKLFPKIARIANAEQSNKGTGNTEKLRPNINPHEAKSLLI